MASGSPELSGNPVRGPLSAVSVQQLEHMIVKFYKFPWLSCQGNVLSRADDLMLSLAELRCL